MVGEVHLFKPILPPKRVWIPKQTKTSLKQSQSPPTKSNEPILMHREKNKTPTIPFRIKVFRMLKKMLEVFFIYSEYKKMLWKIGR
jgi:hypothetical protein